MNSTPECESYNVGMAGNGRLVLIIALKAFKENWCVAYTQLDGILKQYMTGRGI